MPALADYVGRIPDWCFTQHDAIQAMADARIAWVTTGNPTRKAITDAAITGGLGAIVLDAADTDQLAKFQAAIAYSSANNCVIEWGVGLGAGGFIEIGVGTPIATETLTLATAPNFVGLFTTVENSDIMLINHPLPVAVDIENDDVNVHIDGFIGLEGVSGDPAKLDGVKINRVFPVIDEPIPGTNFRVRVNQRARNGVTSVGLSTTIDFRFLHRGVALTKMPGAQFYCGPTAKLWRKGGGNRFFNSGIGGGDDFTWIGGSAGYFTDDFRGREGVFDGSDGARMIWKGLYQNGLWGINFLTSGADCYLEDILVENAGEEGGGGIRHVGTGLFKSLNIESSDDCFMISNGTGTPLQSIIYIDCIARPWQGSAFAAIFNGDPNYTGPPEDPGGMWPVTVRFLIFNCSGGPGNLQLDTGTGLKCNNNGAQSMEAWVVATSLDKGRVSILENPPTETVAVRLISGRGPVKVTFIDSHIRRSLIEAIGSEGHGTGAAADTIYTSAGTELKLFNTVIDAPITPGVPTIDLWGADLVQIEGCRIGANAGHAVLLSEFTGAKASLAGFAPTTGEVIVNSTLFTGIANDKAAIYCGDSGPVAAVRERFSTFSRASASVTTGRAIRRASSATARTSGTGYPRYNTYDGVTETVTAT